jgi:hypothetical protein
VDAYRLLALLFAIPVAAAQSGLAPEVLLLSKVEHRVTSDLAHMPDFTCMETVRRYVRTNARRTFHMADTLRLEVALVDHKELFSWPGEEAFGPDLAAMVGAGTINIGDFATTIRGIFGNRVATIHYTGPETLRGRETERFEYEIPQMWSGYTIRYANSEGTVASRGSFWVDRASLDLLRVTVSATSIPINLPIAAAETRIDYARVHLDDQSLLTPESSETVLTLMNGHESRNEIEFSHWRKFRAESRLSFGGLASVPEQRKTVERISLPDGLAISIELEAPLDSKIALVGDPIRARLAADAKQKGEVVAPKGALVTGRVRRMELQTDPAPHILVGLEFSEITFEDKRAMFLGRMTGTASWPGVTAGAYSGYADLPGVGTLYVEGKSFVLPKGFRMDWRAENERRQRWQPGQK